MPAHSKSIEKKLLDPYGILAHESTMAAMQREWRQKEEWYEETNYLRHKPYKWIRRARSQKARDKHGEDQDGASFIASISTMVEEDGFTTEEYDLDEDGVDRLRSRRDRSVYGALVKGWFDGRGPGKLLEKHACF